MPSFPADKSLDMSDISEMNSRAMLHNSGGSMNAPGAVSLPCEQRLLLLCARLALDEQHVAELRALLQRSLDWGYVLQLADEHRVISLLYWRLQAIGFAGVPEDARAALQEQFNETAWNNPRMAYEMLEIVDLFRQHGIPALPYKGPMLALQVYGNLALRQFIDLDIMIPRQHFAKAKQVLLARGYHPNRDYVTLADEEHIRTHHDYPFLSQDGEVAVELQWGVMQVPFVFPRHFERWWGRLRPTSVAGRTVLGMAPEELLLVLAMHGSKHLWFRLIWICDIAALLHAFPKLDWAVIRRSARNAGCLHMLHLALLLAETLLEAQLPAAVSRHAHSDAIANGLAREVCSLLFAEQDLLANLAERAPLFYLQMMDRFLDRLWLCAYCYPSLIRPGRMLRLYGLQPFRYLLGI